MVVTRTPQDFAGPAYEEEIIFYDQYGALPIENGTMVYSDGYFYLRDVEEIYVPISAEKHEKIKQLIHYIDDGPTYLSGTYREILPARDPFPTSVIWWESSGKVRKIVETIITRNANKMPSSIVWNLYDGGSVIETITDSIVYQNNIFEVSRVRIIG
jgi:hypothetical protein